MADGRVNRPCRLRALLNLREDSHGAVVMENACRLWSFGFAEIAPKVRRLRGFG